jgi:hypothetical protein
MNNILPIILMWVGGLMMGFGITNLTNIYGAKQRATEMHIECLEQGKTIINGTRFKCSLDTEDEDE